MNWQQLLKSVLPHGEGPGTTLPSGFSKKTVTALRASLQMQDRGVAQPNGASAVVTVASADTAAGKPFHAAAREAPGV